MMVMMVILFSMRKLLPTRTSVCRYSFRGLAGLVTLIVIFIMGDGSKSAEAAPPA